MNTREIIAQEEQFQIPTYKKYPFALERGDGCYVWDTDGNKYLDFYGGHCVTLLGHAPPRVVDAIKQQVGQLIFYSNVCYSPVRARTAALIASMSPPEMNQVFFCNSGTEANETALKLARTVTGKNAIVAMDGGFHGRTLGSLSATWNPKYRAPYRDILPETIHLPFGNIEAVATLFEQRDDIAGIIVEPVQSMAGVVEAAPNYYRQLKEHCLQNNVVLIFDEVQTGVGRTGSFSISEQYGMKPDLITLAKSLGSGVPVGAVLVSDAISKTIGYGDHGTTFGGGMLAMAAVEATLTTIQEGSLMQRAPIIFESITQHVAPHVVSVRGRGCLIGIELDVPARPVINSLRESGIIVGTAVPDRVMRIMPPLITTEDDIQFFASRLSEVLDAMKTQSAAAS